MALRGHEATSHASEVRVGREGGDMSTLAAREAVLERWRTWRDEWRPLPDLEEVWDALSDSLEAERMAIEVCAKRVEAYAFSLEVRAHMGLPGAAVVLEEAARRIRALAPNGTSEASPDTSPGGQSGDKWSNRVCFWGEKE